MCNAGYRASFHCEGEVSWFFSTFGLNFEYILELWREWPFKTQVCSARSGLLSDYEGHLWILLEDWHGNRDASRGEVGDPESISICHIDIGILINF